MQDKVNKIILGAGCFWCTQALFKRFIGVQKVISGYAGGNTKNPTYEQVSSKSSGHAQVCQIYYHRQVITLQQILLLFFEIHDPTEIKKTSGKNISNYRSIILFETQEQHKIILRAKMKIQEEKIYSKPILTQIKKLQKFYPAQTRHQNYYDQNKNANNSYCKLISSKILDMKNRFKEKILN